ncbi:MULTISPECIES: hypothetical protein [Bacillales]|jgi:hypothetical protein|uniref:Sublancin immunity protein SunI-like PH domain-containing protein n=1 Tax=Fictibacillus norfolkensis TaxID=2762233 RepID=A0ABR8SIZ0_9BACL|nr:MULTISPECIES: hypothetical protein [Bacillaceae]MBD7963451.1 hypothetical protein [Fictibacillus norfolkensis]
MIEVSVKKIDNNFIIRWQLLRVEIPADDILNVGLDDTYGGDDKEAIRIGFPYGMTDRVFIETKKQTYILFTSNPSAIMKKLSA